MVEVESGWQDLKLVKSLDSYNHWLFVYNLGNITLVILIKHSGGDVIEAIDIHREFKSNVMTEDYNLEVIVYWV